MRALIYGYRADEEAAFEEFTARLGIEPVYLRQNLCRETAAQAEGIEAIAVNAMSQLDRENLKRLGRPVMHRAAFSLSGEGLRENVRKKERPRQEGEPAGAIKEGIYGAGSLAPINCF